MIQLLFGMVQVGKNTHKYSQTNKINKFYFCYSPLDIIFLIIGNNFIIIKNNKILF